MKTQIIDVELMKNWYVIGSWLYWNVNIGQKIKKHSLAGCLSKSRGYYRVCINGTSYYNHRILYQFYHNIILEPEQQIDHINGIKTDNRKENLRLCNQSGNNMNRKVQKNNKLGLKNIHIKHSKNFDYYVVLIKKDHKFVHSKTYRTDEYTLEDVIKIRDIELLKHHGEYMNKGDLKNEHDKFA